MKSRSIAGLAAAVAAAAGVAADVVVAGDTETAGGVAGMPGAADALGGVLIAAAFSSGGITDSVETDCVADELADDTNPNGIDPWMGDPVTGDLVTSDSAGIDFVGVVTDAGGGGGNVGTTIPGGGAATARGSSISSTGRSGKASWNGDPVGAADSGAATAVALSRGVRAKSGGELGMPFLLPVLAVSLEAPLRAEGDAVAEGALPADAGALLVGPGIGFAVPGSVAPARLAAALLPMGAWPVATANEGAPDVVAAALRTAVAAAAARIFAAAAARAALLAAAPVAAPGEVEAAGAVEGAAGSADAFATGDERPVALAALTLGAMPPAAPPSA